jgi:hypothetical protein
MSLNEGFGFLQSLKLVGGGFVKSFHYWSLPERTAARVNDKLSVIAGTFY